MNTRTAKHIRRIGIGALLLFGICVGLMGSGCKDGAAGGGIPLSEWYASVLAEEAVAVTGDEDARVLVLTQGFSPNMIATAEARAEVMDRHDRVDVVAVATIMPPNADPVAAAMTGIPADEFVRVAREHPSANVVLSFDAAPSLRGGNIKAAASQLPPMICSVGDAAFAAALIKSGMAAVAIYPSSTRSPHANPQTAREYFENSYGIVKK